MKHFAYTLAVAGMMGSLGTFAAAQSGVDAATTTCADFMAMSAADQRAALNTLNRADAGASADSSASTEGTDAGAGVSAGTDAVTSMTDDTASEAADADTSMDTGTDTSADTTSETTDLSAEAGSDASADASEDPEVQAMIAACEGNEDALVAEQAPAK